MNTVLFAVGLVVGGAGLGALIHHVLPADSTWLPAMVLMGLISSIIAGAIVATGGGKTVAGLLISLLLAAGFVYAQGRWGSDRAPWLGSDDSWSGSDDSSSGSDDSSGTSDS